MSNTQISINTILERGRLGRSVFPDYVGMVAEGFLNAKISDLPSPYAKDPEVLLTYYINSANTFCSRHTFTLTDKVSEVITSADTENDILHISFYNALSLLALFEGRSRKFFLDWKKKYLNQDTESASTKSKDTSRSSTITNQFNKLVIPFLQLSVQDYLEYLNTLGIYDFKELYSLFFRKECENWQSKYGRSISIGEVLALSRDVIQNINNEKLNYIINKRDCPIQLDPLYPDKPFEYIPDLNDTDFRYSFRDSLLAIIRANILMYHGLLSICNHSIKSK